MEIINRCLTLEAFEDYVRRYDFGATPPDKLVIHHTWKPTRDEWSGQHTILALKQYYESQGWQAGPHLFIAREGIWLFSPMDRDGVHSSELNARSIGIEVVGDYDREKWVGIIKRHAIGAIKVLLGCLHIPQERIHFHREVAAKSCPGWAITKEWLFAELADSFSDVPSETGRLHKAAGAFSAPAVPVWARAAVEFVQEHQLFEIRGEDDWREAVKFFRLYQLLRS